MTSLFGGSLKKATREVVLVKERYLQVTDQVQAAGKPASVRWTMVTSATPKLLDPHTMELTKEGKKLHVIIDSPSAAIFRWSIMFRLTATMLRIPVPSGLFLMLM